MMYVHKNAFYNEREGGKARQGARVKKGREKGGRDVKCASPSELFIYLPF